MTWMKKLTVAGVVAIALAGVGCEDRRNDTLREDTREMGRDMERGANEAGEQMEGAAQDVEQGVEEGVGGSGDPRLGDGKVGENEGVINDGEGPVERMEQNTEQ